MENPTAGASNESRKAAAAKSKGRKRTSSLVRVFCARLTPVRGGTGLYHTRRTAVLGNLVRGCIPGGSDRILYVGAAPCMLPGGGGGHARGNQDQRGGEQDRGFLNEGVALFHC